MRSTTARRVSVLLVVLLALPHAAGVAAGISGGGALQPAHAAAVDSQSDGPRELVFQQDNATATPTPGESSGEETEGAPSAAETVRITPVRFDEEYLSVTVQEPDSVFNTSGPFAQFSLSEPADAVRISQSGAQAELQPGGQVVVVRYADDAAPDPEHPSLYTLEIFYPDGSKTEVQLYADSTEVSAEAATLETYKPLIFDLRDDARANGYEDTPEGVEQYYEDTKERAELLESLFTEQAIMAVNTAIAWFLNPVAIAVTLALVAVGSYYRLQRRGYSLDIISNDTGKAQRLRERLRLSYKQNQQTADEERLKELPEIGSMSEVYWRDAETAGVATVYQLAELARSGKTAERDGDLVKVHNGVEDLQAEDLSSTWLEPVAGSGRQRIASYDIALSHIKTALERMMSTYGMGHLYRETYEDVVELIDARQRVIRSGSSSTSSSGSAAAGGS